MPRIRQQPWRWLQVPLLLAGLVLAIRRLHRQQGFDLIHAHWLVPQGLGVLVALRAGHRPPMVVTSHGGDLHTLGQSRVAGLLRRVLRASSGITTVSPLLAREAAVLLGYEPRNAEVIPMGVDVKAFAAIKANSHIHHDDFVRLLFVGRLAEKKGVRFLLEALALMATPDTRVRLQIVGDGPLRQGLEELARQLHIGHQVEFLGARPYREIPVHMAAADILVAPSVEASDGDCEGLPTVILEAMAAQLVVVTTPVGGITQVIEDHQTGRLVPAGDAGALAEVLDHLLSDPEERQQLARHAFAAVQAYDWETVAGRYAAVLQAAMETGDA